MATQRLEEGIDRYQFGDYIGRVVLEDYWPLSVAQLVRITKLEMKLLKARHGEERGFPVAWSGRHGSLWIWPIPDQDYLARVE